jgi:phage-related minor tail protein
MSRSFSTGWKKAMNDYVANATNAAQRAQELFSRATKGMEDAIVGFAKTGKFEWKSFVADMLEQLLRSQIQQVFASMMGGMQNSMSGFTGAAGGGNLLGGLLGGVGSLFGGGSSGYMPGESSGMPTGTSLFGGIGDIVGSIGSGIGSVVSGIGDFFGGFFANGGNLGAGKWGIAGENGPELISGPASVTPMGGGGVTNVTYNINAVDAMSFKQLVAQDPGFIYAVTQQGARSMPGTRR